MLDESLCRISNHNNRNRSFLLDRANKLVCRVVFRHRSSTVAQRKTSRPREHVNVVSRVPCTGVVELCWQDEAITLALQENGKKVDRGSERLDRVPGVNVPVASSSRPSPDVWLTACYVPVADDHALDGLHPGCPMLSVVHT